MIKHSITTNALLAMFFTCACHAQVDFLDKISTSQAAEYFRSGKYDNARDAALTDLRNIKDDDMRINMMMLLGLCYDRTNDYQNAILTYLNIANQYRMKIGPCSSAISAAMKVFKKRNRPRLCNALTEKDLPSDRWTAWELGRNYINLIKSAHMEATMTEKDRPAYNELVDTVNEYGCDAGIQHEEQIENAYKKAKRNHNENNTTESRAKIRRGNNDSKPKTLPSIQQLIQQANSEDVVAQKELAYAYFDGQHVQKDYTKAVELFLKAAEHGDKDAARMAEFIYSANLESRGEYLLALRKTSEQFSMDPSSFTADILLEQMNRILFITKEKIEKGFNGRPTPMRLIHENLAILESIKESVLLLETKVQEMTLAEDISSDTATSFAQDIREFKKELRNTRTEYVSIYAIYPYLREGRYFIHKADEPTLGHDRKLLRHAICILSSCASPEILFTADETTRLMFLDTISEAKEITGKAEWEELRQYTKIMDSLDKEQCKGGILWLP